MRKAAHRKLQSRRAHPAQRSLPRMLQTEIQMHTDRCGALLYRAEYGRKGLRGLPRDYLVQPGFNYRESPTKAKDAFNLS